MGQSYGLQSGPLGLYNRSIDWIWGHNIDNTSLHDSGILEVDDTMAILGTWARTIASN